MAERNNPVSAGRAGSGAGAASPSPHILLATGAVYLYPLRSAFALARDAGCDGVELDVSCESMLRRASAVARLAGEYGQPVRAVHPPLLGLPGWGRRGRGLSRLADYALALQAPLVVLHPPHARRLESPGVEAFVARLRQAQHRLEGTGTRIVLENPGYFGAQDEQLIFWHLPALRRLAEECGLAMALDTTHAGSSRYPLLASYDALRDRLAHVHLSDLRDPPSWLDHPWLYSYVKHHQLPGSGHLPLREFLHRLSRDGYRGYITLELSPVSLHIWDAARSRELLAGVVQATRAAFAAE